jgi:hypothetical protein
MNPIIGWVLAALALVTAGQTYGVKGLALGATLIVFWLVLQFNRSVRVMKNASSSPIGQVPNAVMFNARLKAGLTMLDLVAITRSLGRKLADEPERWAWTDESGSTVTITLAKGRVTSWRLDRPDEEAEAAPPP